MTRREKLLSGLDLTHTCGIEIGALTSPIVGKTESEVYYVDHADREALQAKYASDPNVDVQKIIRVDAVWGENTLRECFPGDRKFDYAIASHVIEHVPDLLGWMQELAEVLRPGGRLILAIPDKRYTFDYLRQPSRLSEVVDAYLRRNRRPMPAQIFDYNANAVHLDMESAWNGVVDEKSLKHFVTLQYALDRSIESIRDGKYIDGHCWVFTDLSLACLLAELAKFDLLAYRCLHLYETERNTNEFLLILERLGFVASKEESEGAVNSFLFHANRLKSRMLFLRCPTCLLELDLRPEPGPRPPKLEWLNCSRKGCGQTLHLDVEWSLTIPSAAELKNLLFSDFERWKALETGRLNAFRAGR